MLKRGRGPEAEASRWPVNETDTNAALGLLLRDVMLLCTTLKIRVVEDGWHVTAFYEGERHRTAQRSSNGGPMKRQEGDRESVAFAALLADALQSIRNDLRSWRRVSAYTRARE